MVRKRHLLRASAQASRCCWPLRLLLGMGESVRILLFQMSPATSANAPGIANALIDMASKTGPALGAVGRLLVAKLWMAQPVYQHRSGKLSA